MKKLFTFLLILINMSVLKAQQWSDADSIAYPVRAGNTAAYSKGNNAWLFIVSGRGLGDKITKKVQRYNLNTNVWDTMMPHPTGMLGAATAIVNDSLYVIGGVVNPPDISLNKVMRLDLINNTWKELANFPFHIVDAKAVSYQDSLIYVAGGSGAGNTGIVYLYNVVENSWRKATNFPSLTSKSFGGFARVKDTLIYMCGTDGFGSRNLFKQVHVGVINKNDHSKITWSLGQDFPGKTRVFFDAHEWGSKGIIMTGGSTDHTFTKPSDECYTYSPGENVWKLQSPKPTAWTTGQSASIQLADSTWKLICTSGYNKTYLYKTEIYSEKLIPLGFKKNTNKKNDFLVYPNPSDQMLIVKSDLNIKESEVKLVEISNQSTIKIKGEQIEFDGNFAFINTEKIPNGVYILVISNNKKLSSKKVIIQH